MTAAAWADPIVVRTFRDGPTGEHMREWSDGAVEPYLPEPDELPATAIRPLPGLDLDKLAAPRPEPKWLIRGRMTEGSLTVLGSKPGVGKSWLSADLALALALGRPWLGCEPVGPRRVLYLDAENGEDLALRRLRQLGGRSADLQGRLRYSTDPLVLTSALDHRRFLATLEEHQPDLVVIDTLSSHAPAAESDTEHMSRFLADVWNPCRAAGRAVLLLHHLRKSLQGVKTDDLLDSLRGSGHLAASIHRAWILAPITPGQPHFTLHDPKPREFASVAPTRVRVVDDPDSPHDDRRTYLEVQGIEEVFERGYDTYLSGALTFIDCHPTGEASTKDLVHLGMAQDVAERSCKDYLARAVTAGVLHKPRRGFWTRAQGPLTTTDHDTDGT